VSYVQLGSTLENSQGFNILTLDIFKLYRNFWDFAFENPEKIKPNHIAIFSFAIEHCNRLGWKKKFGLPSTMTMEAVGIKSYNTYITAFNELVEYGFIELIEKSKNQYSSNIIALSNNFKALDKALDKAFIKHTTKQDESTIQSTGESISSIDIQETTIQETNLQDEIVFNFKTALLELGIETKIVLEWLQVRKKKKLTNSETAFNSIKKEIQKSGLTPNECIKIAVEKSWGGIDAEWLEKYKPKPEENFFTKMGIPR
jgi:hypothetical protein